MNTAMVTRRENTTEIQGRVKVRNLKPNKETVNDLSASQQKQIQGGHGK